jgi:tetratricopeptide (TPR) repeat protein
MTAVLAALCAPSSASGDTSPASAAEAKKHMQRGLAEYEGRRYEHAILEFRDAYALDPKRETLFAWAQAERLSGDCPSAVELYRRFLDAQPPPAEAEKASLQLARCEQALATRPAAAAPAMPAEAVAPKETPPPPVPEAPPPTPRAPAPPSPWYTDVPGGALVGAGIVGLGVSGGFFLASRGSESDARSAATYGDFSEASDLLERRLTVSAIALAAGSTLIVLGVVRYLTRGTRGEAVAARPMSR